MAEQSVPRLMIVTGDDNFAMELARDRYLERVRAARGQCAVEMFDSLNERIGDFLGRAVTASLFEDVRVFCVLHAQSLTEKDLAELDKTLDYDIPDVYMFVSAELEKKSAAETKVKKVLRLKERGGGAALVQDLSKPRDYERAGKIMELVPQLFNRRIGKPDAEYLAEVVEYDLIYSELQKIDMALPPGAPIDKKIIQEIAGATRTMTVYELAAALGKRDLPGALQALDSLFAAHDGRTLFSIAVPALFRHFWPLFKMKKYLEKRPDVLRQYNSRGYGKDSPQSMAAFEIGLACGLLTERDRAGNRAYPVIIKSGVVNQAQSFSYSGLRDILRMLQRFDVDVKTFKTDPVPYSFQMLCYRIARAA
jgi:DNA polymerase III delta subunit